MDLGFASAPFISSPLVAPSTFSFSLLSLSLSSFHLLIRPLSFIYLYIRIDITLYPNAKGKKAGGGWKKCHRKPRQRTFTNRLPPFPIKGDHSNEREIRRFDFLTWLLFPYKCIYVFFTSSYIIFILFCIKKEELKERKKRFTLVCRSMARGRTIHLGREARESVSRNG